MSKLTLSLHPEVNDRIDLSGIIPERLFGRTQAEIGKIRIQAGQHRLTLGKLFKIEGSARSASELVLRGIRGQADYIGRGMGAGRLVVHGTAGDFLGHEMTGGYLSARGDAGRWAGRDMRGGFLEIHGNAGDYLAAAFPGDRHGMREGIIHVRGSAGQRAGERMRRGIVIIDEDVENYCGHKMLAGTIIVQGQAGKFTGTAMKRGTILLAGKPSGMPATFNTCGEYAPAFLALLYRSLANTSRHLKYLADWPIEVQRLAGDLAVGGKGEILILQAPVRK
ncbi:MAG: formylmethanofuran dehydrogenase subunit C [Gammaproteobacteria bacterium]|nr:formylmethanofuran dehydrogenase subunit C [Gammaproteobacteria bacterium]